MAYADEQSYEEMISTLQTFVSQVSEQCEVMSSAGTDCVDNTDGDPAAEKSNAKLQECIKNIQSATESVQGIISALQEELEDIREAAQRADSID